MTAVFIAIWLQPLTPTKKSSDLNQSIFCFVITGDKRNLPSVNLIYRSSQKHPLFFQKKYRENRLWNSSRALRYNNSIYSNQSRIYLELEHWGSNENCKMPETTRANQNLNST